MLGAALSACAVTQKTCLPWVLRGARSAVQRQRSVARRTSMESSRDASARCESGRGDTKEREHLEAVVRAPPPNGLFIW